MFRVLCLMCIISIFLQPVVSKNITVKEQKSEDKDALRNTKKGDFYYVVSVKLIFTTRDARRRTWQACCGVLIKESSILAAANCFEKSKKWISMCCTRGGYVRQKEYKALAAAHRGNKFFQANGQTKHITRFTTHPNYSHPHKDVAIAHTESPFVFNNNVNALPYATKYGDDYGSNMCKYIAFAPEEGDDNRFSHIDVKLIPDKQCYRQYGRSMHGFICVSFAGYERHSEPGAVVCTNTSDPSDKGDGVVVGIQSYLHSYPVTYFTRVSTYSDFITANENCAASFLVPYSIWLSLVVSYAYKSAFTE